MGKQILITGGSGYVGSHATVELLKAGYECIVVDNLHNSYPESLRRVEKITEQKVTFYELDLLDKNTLNEVFSKHEIYAVMHFAGLKAVGESIEIPLHYYHNNITGTLHLLQCMKEHKVYNLIFSSSATVYGTPNYLPLDEKHPVGTCTNPYGKSKYFIEEILKDLAVTSEEWNIILLRYFNPVGADKSGMIGEDPLGIPNNLMPYITQVAAGRRPHLNVFGSDYDTFDGTGVRDYIHVTDLACGHVAALKKIDEKCGLKIYNLGSGRGYSVLEMVKGMEKACAKEIPYKVAPRRPGDVAVCYGDPSLALKELNWKTEHTLDDICQDCWRWQSQNPSGFRKSPQTKP